MFEGITPPLVGLGIGLMALGGMFGYLCWELYQQHKHESLGLNHYTSTEPRKKKAKKRLTIGDRLRLSGIPAYRSRYAIPRAIRWVARHGNRRQRQLMREFETGLFARALIRKSVQAKVTRETRVDDKFLNRGPREKRRAHEAYIKELQAQMLPSRVVDATPLPVTFKERLKAFFIRTPRAA